MTARLFVLIVLCGACGCAKVETPQPPPKMPATIVYDSGISRLIIPREYNGGVWVCTEDVQGLHAPDCVQLQTLRRFTQGFAFADGGAGW